MAMWRDTRPKTDPREEAELMTDAMQKLSFPPNDIIGEIAKNFPRPEPDGDVDSAAAQAVPKGLPFIIIISLCMYMYQKRL